MTSLITRGLLAPIAALALIAIMPPASDAQEGPNDFSAIVERMTPTVVAVTARRMVEAARSPLQMLPPPFQDMFPRPFGMPGGPAQPEQFQGTALGSGFIISKEGHIVTNNHVIEDASEIEVIMSDGSSQRAELVGADPVTDLAVLKVDSPQDFAVAEWGDSDALKPGAWTIAIGSPFGLGGTVTVGVLSARSRDIRSGPYDNFLQTDTSINRGNSGGPLFNASGQVIGVNTAIFSPIGANIGIGFAVPSSTARDVVTQLVETGSVERGFIGVSLQPITDAMAGALGLDSTDGALVADVEPDSPGAEAGLQAGDVITHLNSEAVEDPRELSRAVAGRGPGEEVTLSVQRGGEAVEVELTLAPREMPQTQSGQQEEEQEQDGSGMGIAVSELPEELRRELGLGSGQGVIVQQVMPGSPAAEAGLFPGDVIVEAGDQPVGEPDDLASAWNTARDGDQPVLLRVVRRGSPLFVAVEAGQE